MLQRQPGPKARLGNNCGTPKREGGDCIPPTARVRTTKNPRQFRLACSARRSCFANHGLHFFHHRPDTRCAFGFEAFKLAMREDR